MKKIIKKSLIALAFISIILPGCEKNSDTDPSVVTTDRDKFLGSWITTSTGPVHGTLNFTMSISAGTSSASQIVMENFDAEGSGTFVFGGISGSSVSIQQQVVNGDTIQGSGMYNANGTLSFTYTFRDGQTVDNRTATAHK